jgi:hypothetical protein
VATGSDLRDLLHDDDGARGSGGLDADAVIRRAKRRRLPRQLAVGGIGVLAVIAVAVPSVAVARAFLGGSGAAGSSTQSQGIPGGVTGQSDGGTLGRNDTPSEGSGAGGAVGSCTAPDQAPATGGLSVTVAFPDPAAGAGAVDGTVTIANGGTTTVSGWLASSPTIVLRKDGRVAAIAVGALPRAATRIDLAPGQSLAYPVSLPLVGCESGHPPLGAGGYAAGASIQFTTSAPGTGTTDSSAEVTLVGGPSGALRIG